MSETLGGWACESGFRVAWSDISVVGDVRKEIEARRATGELDEEFFHDKMAPWVRDPVPGWARSIIVAAVPRPAHRVVFHVGGREFGAIIPPTYALWDEMDGRLRAGIASVLGGVRLERVRVPLKAIAASLGVVRYGRNNITYVPGMGSYHQLAGYVTDADPAVLGDAGAGEGGRGAPQVAVECGDCGACAGACPTGAIDPGRFLLHAERCVTLANESEDPWPGWLPPGAHNCLVGCMICQEACPMNAGLLSVETVETAFSEEETGAILAGRHSKSVAGKFASLELEGFERDAGRNLRALLEARAIF